jgi:hypothetical protein
MERAWSTLRPASNDWRRQCPGFGGKSMPAQGEGGGGRHGLRSQHQRQPAEAMAAVVAIIHQHFMLIEAMTVVENVMLGWSQAGWILKRAEIAARIRETSGRFGLDLNPDAVIGKCRSVVGSASSPAALSPAWAEPCYPFSRSEPLPTA